MLNLPPHGLKPMELDPSIDLDLLLPDYCVTFLPWTLYHLDISVSVFPSSVWDLFLSRLPDNYTNLLFVSPLHLDNWLPFYGLPRRYLLLILGSLCNILPWLQRATESKLSFKDASKASW